MQCSTAMKAFIAGGLLLSLGALSLVPHNRAHGVAGDDPEIVATQKAKNIHFKNMDEISGIAIAGFRDEEGSPLLWGHNATVSAITLLRTRPSRSLYAGELNMPGEKTRDAEDIATVVSNGKGTIYLQDAGTNRKDLPACVRYARHRDDPGRCSIVDSYLVATPKKSKKEQADPREACLARGEDWFWLAETSRFDPGEYPSIRRIPEPTYQDVLRGKLAMATTEIEFDYPRRCGERPCREYPVDSKQGQIKAAYNVESLAVIVEPDQSHTAYLFSKAPHPLGRALKTQRPAAAGCTFAGDGRSDVFRLRHLDTLPPGKRHQAEYVATLGFSASSEAAGERDPVDRVTAANFMKLSDSQGLLLIRTTNGAYKWPIELGRGGTDARPSFDVEAALRNIEPAPARVPTASKKAGIAVSNQEAVAQLDESSIYYMGECKGMRRCGVAKVRDDHAYLAGDANGNGRIDKGDPAILKRAIAGDIALYCKAAADADGDGHLSPADVDYLDAYLGKRGPAPVLRGQAEGEAGLSCGYYKPASLHASLNRRRGG